MPQMKCVFEGLSILLLALSQLNAESQLPFPQNFNVKGKPILPECISHFF